MTTTTSKGPIAEATALVRSLRTYFELSGDGDEGVVVFDTRQHGCMMTDTAGAEDVAEARRLATAIRERIGGVRVSIVTCDEWTILEIWADR